MPRTKLEIATDILEALNQNRPLRITHLTLKARVNYALLKPILINLTEKNFIQTKQTKNTTLYTITPKGKQTLQKYKKFEKPNPAITKAATQYNQIHTPPPPQPPTIEAIHQFIKQVQQKPKNT